MKALIILLIKTKSRKIASVVFYSSKYFIIRKQIKFLRYTKNFLHKMVSNVNKLALLIVMVNGFSFFSLFLLLS